MEEKKKRNKSLTIGERKYYTQFTEKFENRTAWKKANPKELRAVLPCSIEKINSVEKKSYKKGELLLTFKAMKMVNSLLMPFSGKVKTIHVKEGDSVKKNQLLMEIE